MTICRTLAICSPPPACCRSAAATAEGITVHDARDRDVVIDDPSRIVSIGGAITEILYALGFEDRIAGVDATSLYPPSALRDKPNVGYMRQLSPEGVLGLQSVAGARGAGLRAEGNHGRAGGGQGAAGAGARNLFRGRTGREDQAGRPRHGRRTTRAACLATAVDSDLAQLRDAARQGDEAGARDVRDVAVERPGDGRGPQDRRQRDHPARRRRQRDRRL